MQGEVTISPQIFLNLSCILLILLCGRTSPQALTCFSFRLNRKLQNRVATKRATLFFCSFLESVSLLRSQRYEWQPVIGLRGDILSLSWACVGWNNPFLYGLLRPAPWYGPVQFRFQLDYCFRLWRPAAQGNLECSHPLLICFVLFSSLQNNVLKVPYYTKVQRNEKSPPFFC